MNSNPARWESLVLATSFALALGALAIAGWLSISSELGLQGALPRLVLIVGLLAILVGLAGYAAVRARPVVLSRVGAMAFVAAFFLGVVGYFLAAAGILWVIVASRRGSPFIVDERMLAVSVIWAGVFVVGWLLHDDPICVDGGAFCTSDAIVWWEAIVGLCLGVSSALVALAGDDRRPESSDHMPVDTGAAS